MPHLHFYEPETEGLLSFLCLGCFTFLILVLALGP